jgi:CheY-like chemotaxis protein
MDTERIHILVVDDLTDMAESTAEMLTLWGYSATACDSGVAALACARIRRPDAVLLDLAMPRMDGFQFARAFRGLKGYGAVPLIAVSGHSFLTSSARAFQAGIEHSLLKPMDPNRLKALLVSLTQGAAIPSSSQIEKRWGSQRLRSRHQHAAKHAVPALIAAC